MTDEEVEILAMAIALEIARRTGLRLHCAHAAAPSLFLVSIVVIVWAR